MLALGFVDVGNTPGSFLFGCPIPSSGKSVHQLEQGKVKVKFTLEQATKAQRGSRGIAVLFL